MLKPTNARKMEIYVFRSVGVKPRVAIPQNKVIFVFIWFMVIFGRKIISTKSMCTSNHSFINP